jgi:hypothetical protein
MFKHPIILAICLLMLSGICAAQTIMDRSVVGGGGTRMTGSVLVTGTIGQAVTGENEGAQTLSKHGFWYQVMFATSTPVETPAVAGENVTLWQNYPNPFSPATAIRFSVARAAHVTLAIFDLMGRQVSILIDEPVQSGDYLVKFEGQTLPAGTYICRLTSNGRSAQRMMQLMK